MRPTGLLRAYPQQCTKRWEQLEADPELAGPWHQLFKQVQSPRHVLSELLQNADDAGATEACVMIEDGIFIFSHNGEDFIEEHFASLCRFGYSNKRALHTIGFRGIGFKSTFSLGDTVELSSRQHSRSRLTKTDSRHRDGSRRKDTDAIPMSAFGSPASIAAARIEKNLKEWIASPISLLFFKNIRSMHDREQEARWESLGPGPVPESEWMALKGDPQRALPDHPISELRISLRMRLPKSARNACLGLIRRWISRPAR